VAVEREKDPTLRGLLRTFDRRRLTIVVVTGACVLASILLCIVTTRRYMAVGVAQLQKSSSDSLGLDDLMGAAAGGASDSLSVNVDLQTQAYILQSDALALKVIKDLNLEKNPDFIYHFSVIDWATSLISPKGPADPVNAPIDQSPRRREQALLTFSKHLTVKVVAGTRLLEVDFVNRDPKVAADVVNDLIEALIDYTFETKYTATSKVSKWLEGQIGDLRKQSEDLQAQVVKLQQGSGIFGVGGSDLQGKPVVYSPVLDKLQASTALMTQAEMNRIMKESVYEAIKSGDPETLSQLTGTSMSGPGGQGVQSSLTFLQTLRTQEATLQTQIAQDESQFGPEYPKLIQEKASMRGLQPMIQSELRKITARAKNDYKIALRSEIGAKKTYARDRADAEALNDKSIDYQILSKEATESSDLYQDLLKRLKEAGILEGLHSTDLTVVDPAEQPAKPSQPKVPLYIGLGLLAGLFLGASSALFVEAIDNKIPGVEEVEEMELPLIGVIPQIDAQATANRPILLNTGHSGFAEGVRALRSTLLISRSGTPPQVILITSGSPGEGKSTLSLNLAVALSQFDKSVLLIEADMRRPVMRKRLSIPGTVGLSHLLAGQEPEEAAQPVPSVPKLTIIPGGMTPPYPSELLGSDRMRVLIERLRTQYDFIVIDSPPVLPVTDALVLEGYADATVLVARLNSTTKIALKRSYSLLLQHVKDPSTPRIGVVLNFLSERSAAYYGYYGYYGGKKYGYESEEQ
jgi:succinoglycan biosynthesis transport protein ExoP